jgi:hypothetical protein
MTLERVRKWIDAMPATERLLPIMHHAGRWWTPNDILQQVQGCPSCPLSLELQRMLEIRALGQDVSVREVAKARLYELLRIQPVEIRTWTLGLPEVITSEKLRRDIETEGTLGSSLINIQERRLVELMSRF